MKLITLITVVLTSLALVACGGDDDGVEGPEQDDPVVESEAVERATGDEPPSKNDYVAAAGDVCAAHQQRLEQRSQELFSDENATEEDLDRFVEDVLVPGAERMVSDLRELEPPDGDEQRVEAIYNAIDDGIDKLREEGFAFEQDPFSDADQLARAYGLLECIGEAEGQGGQGGQGGGE